MSDRCSSAITSLNNGLVIAYPTEAVFGLGCDPTNEHAVQMLLKLKQRPVSKGLILIAGDFSLLEPFVDVSSVPAQQWQNVINSWPGPLTWVLPKSEQCPKWVSGDFDSVAVRVSAHPVVVQLTKQFKQPIVSTSANLAGQQPAINASQVFAMFGDVLGDVIDAPLGEQQQPSKIFDALSGQQFR